MIKLNLSLLPSTQQSNAMFNEQYKVTYTPDFQRNLVTGSDENIICMDG
jgi:hypothetical protein